ncbi:MAG: DNA mismatch repair protein MutS [Candidatus Zixiibacteriota bacterium]
MNYDMVDDVTPLMRQYFKIKDQYPEEIVFFRMGDFYEMFGRDAKVASEILGIALTSRGQIKGEKIPLAGVPYHAAEKYLSKLLKAGKKVVVCEQVEDPKLAKGIVRREVVEIVTPGTVTIDGVIEGTESNYLASLFGDEENMGLSILDLTTGEFKVDYGGTAKIMERLRVISPSEIIIPDHWSDEKMSGLESSMGGTTLTTLEGWKFDYDFAYHILVEHFKVTSLDGFGCQSLKSGIQAAGAILAYLKQTKKALLSHINRLSPFFEDHLMFLDASTIRNLELLTPLGGEAKGHTLFSLLNRTRTAMGARLLRSWIILPLLNVEKIKGRQEAVAELLGKRDLSENLTDRIRRVADLERLAGKIGGGKANPRDLVWLKNSLSEIPGIKSVLEDVQSNLLISVKDNLPEVSDLVNLIETSVVDDPPLILSEGGMIKSGYSFELDSVRERIKESKQWIASLQEEERKRTGITSLKVGFNRVFGYFIEVTKPHLSKVPPEYIRKQTMVSAERFVTAELKEKEAYILGAEEEIYKLEHELFLQIRSKVAEDTQKIQRSAGLLAMVDVLLSLRDAAEKSNYVRPEINMESEISIEDGRHPVIENILEPGSFVPNSTKIDLENEQVHIITGPNMAGKSTYLRQVGLIVLLAQIGSYVPAKSAKIGVVDRIFTRVGATDYLTLGQSTFLVEMMETANILNNATSRSLILLDEVGRGTSTFDGLSIARAVTEYIHNHPQISAKTLFATHYHELTELAEFLPRVRNYKVEVKQWGDEIIFLRKIIPGGCDDSYGIHVARLAGIPKQVLERAKKILVELEEGKLLSDKPINTAISPQSFQLSIFSAKENGIIEELKKLDLDKLAPIEALNKLSELKKKSEEQGSP